TSLTVRRHERMAFHTADYDTIVVLGDPKAQPLWNWPVWQRLLPALNPLMQAARGKAAVRSDQFLPNRSGTVKFGRIGWKESDHQKWTHGSPKNKEDSKSWSFMSVEVWAPAWTVCERENRAPDVFLSVSDESLLGCQRELAFNPVVVLAVVAELAEREAALLSTAVSTLCQLTSPKLAGYRRRPWGISLGSVGFTNSIQDLAASGLFKPGSRHGRDVGFHLFSEEWKPVSQKGITT